MPGAALAEEREGVQYAALGDSIAYGIGASEFSSYESSYIAPPGMNGYTDMFNKHLSRAYGEVTYANVSLPGVTSAQMKDSLVTPTTAFDFATNAAVTNADILTISIGGNDILQPIKAFIGSNQGYLVPGVLERILAMDMATWPIELQVLAAELGANSTQFGPHWMAIMTDIRATKGSTADIYVNTVYNPFPADSPLYDFAKVFIAGINTPIRALDMQYGYKVVDVGSAFDEYHNKVKPLVHDLTDMTVALHPTDRGYKTIYKMHKNLLH
jgi:lysophospholipase L1-like esterase